MTSLIVPILPQTTDATIEKIRELEEKIRALEQIDFVTEHVFHAGMYSRTVRIPAAVVFTSVLIKRPTLLIVNGTCDLLSGEQAMRLTGYNVIPAPARRKLVYVTRTDVDLTMIFPSEARTVEEAELEFTDEADNLLSRQKRGDIVISTCLESPLEPRS